MDQKDVLNALFEQDSNAAVFHIYHTGSHKQSFSIHTISDSRTALKFDGAPLVRSATEKSHHLLNDNTLFQRRNTWSSIPTKAKRGKYLDKSAHDPRTETSPYYFHRPTLYGHSPSYTLRHGGTKRAPPACLIDSSWFWRKWTMQFGDILAQDGVIDGRGVVNMKYGTKDGKDGTLRGYAVRAKRYMGESGKQWFRTHKALQGENTTEHVQKVKPNEVVQLAWASPFSTRTREYHFTWRDFTFKWKGTKSVRRSENFFQPFLRYNHLKLIVAVPSKDVNAREEELLLATYISVPASRKAGRLELYQDKIDDFLSEHIYDVFGLKADTFGLKADTFGLKADTFGANDDTFKLKGDTFQQQGDPFRLQGDTFQQNGDPFHLQGDTFHLQGDTFQMKDDSESRVKALDEKKAPPSAKTPQTDSKPDQRLRDLLVASAMCMVISEYQKRQVIIQIILAALNATG